MHKPFAIWTRLKKVMRATGIYGSADSGRFVDRFCEEVVQGELSAAEHTEPAALEVCAEKRNEKL